MKFFSFTPMALAMTSAVCQTPIALASQDSLRGSSNSTLENELTDHRHLLDIDAQTATGKIVATFAGKIPVVGSYAKLMVDVFWPPTSGLSAWEEIEAQLLELLDERFRDAKFHERMNSLLTHMNKIGNHDEYAESLYETFEASMALDDNGDSTPFLSAAYIMEEMIKLLNEVHVEMRLSKNQMELLGDSDLYQSELETNMLLIPTSLDFAMMHLGFLRDRVLLGPKIYPNYDGENGRYAKHWEAELKGYADTYVEYFTYIEAKWKIWRPTTLKVTIKKRNDRCSKHGGRCNMEGHIYCVADPLNGNKYYRGSGENILFSSGSSCPGDSGGGTDGGKTRISVREYGKHLYYKQTIKCKSSDCATTNANGYVNSIMTYVEQPRMNSLMALKAEMETMGNAPLPGYQYSYCQSNSDCLHSDCDLETNTCEGGVPRFGTCYSTKQCNNPFTHQFCNTDVNQCDIREPGKAMALCTTQDQCHFEELTGLDRYNVCSGFDGGIGRCLTGGGGSCGQGYNCVSRSCVAGKCAFQPTGSACGDDDWCSSGVCVDRICVDPAPQYGTCTQSKACAGNLKCNTDVNQCDLRLAGAALALCTEQNQCKYEQEEGFDRYNVCSAVGDEVGRCLSGGKKFCTKNEHCVSGKCSGSKCDRIPNGSGCKDNDDCQSNNCVANTCEA